MKVVYILWWAAGAVVRMPEHGAGLRCCTAAPPTGAARKLLTSRWCCRVRAHKAGGVLCGVGQDGRVQWLCWVDAGAGRGGAGADGRPGATEQQRQRPRPAQNSASGVAGPGRTRCGVAACPFAAETAGRLCSVVGWWRWREQCGCRSTALACAAARRHWHPLSKHEIVVEFHSSKEYT